MPDPQPSRDAAYYARLDQINGDIARHETEKRVAERSGNSRLAERHNVAIVRLLKEQQLLEQEYDAAPPEMIAIPTVPSEAEQGALDADRDAPSTRLYPRLHNPNDRCRPKRPRPRHRDLP